MHDQAKGRNVARSEDRAPRLPSGPKGLSVVLGRLHAHFDSLTYMERAARTYGSIVRLDPQTYLIDDPAYIEEVLVTANRLFPKTDYEELGEAVVFWGNGLPVNNSDSWLHHRRMVQAAFGPARMAGYGQVMSHMAEEFGATWPTGEVRDLQEELISLTWRISVRNFLGPISEEESGVLRRAVEDTLRLLDNLPQLQLPLTTPDKRRFARVCRG